MVMLANWMLYCVAVGVLLSGGALALERGLRSLRRPTRWVWAGAMVLTLALPAAARIAPAPRPAPMALSPRYFTLTTDEGGFPLSPSEETRTRQGPSALNLGGWGPALRLAWGGSSAAVLLGIAAMAAVLARRRRGWRTVEVDGVPVLVSLDVGPAVVGLFRSRIVLPAWVLAADEEARRLVLAHEREHMRAGDPRLLAAALVLAALTPWNPAAWWQLRRLRLAIEVDCDARVLRRADVRAYGQVLLEIGRRTVRTRLAAAAFAEPVSSLERRIRIMTAPRARRPLLRAAGCAALAAVLAAAAGRAPQPTSAVPSFARTALTPQAAVARYFPEVATKGTAPGDFLEFVVSTDGEVVRHTWVRDPFPDGEKNMWKTTSDFAGQVANYRVVHFKPGEVGPTATEVRWTELRPGPGSVATAAAQAPAQQPQQPTAAGASSGVSIRPDAGVVRVVLTGASPKLRVTARLVDADRAGVLARGKALSGGRFRTAPGRIEVVGAGEGEFEVEIPRDARAATVQVNGHVYVVKDGDSLRVLRVGG
jgi:hypothetical protein